MKTIKEIVQADIDEAKSYECDGYLSDLLQHGCGSGIVNSLITYHDTCQFYEDHKGEINELLKGSLHDTGLSVSELFGDKWDNKDPLAMDINNQNLLAWFGYEETARSMQVEEA